VGAERIRVASAPVSFGVDEIIVDVSLENGEAADVYARLRAGAARL